MAHIHVIEKLNVASHTSIPIPLSSLPPLPNGAIRVRSKLFSLSANNLSYAHGGTTLRWWDAYPVPSSLPSPYNDTSRYGIVPVWGYGEVLESTIPDIVIGQRIWGFWPSHDYPVILNLKRDEKVPGDWLETTEHRSGMMNLYNRYTLASPDLRIENLPKKDLEALAWQTVVGPVGGAGWAINRFVFGSPPIHPFGIYDWTTEDADLSEAVVVSLSASGKTARVFNDAVINEREAGTGPLGLLAVTASSDSKIIPKASLPTKVVSYEASAGTETMDWIQGLKLKKIVIVDFASRGDSLQELLKALESNVSSAKVVVIGVGAESKAHSPEELGENMKKRMAMSNRIQMNASGVYDKAVELLGAEAFYRERREGFERFAARGNLDSMRLIWGEGIVGEKGLEGGWQKLCDQKVPHDAGLVFRI